MIENYQKQVKKICVFLSKVLDIYRERVPIQEYNPIIVKSGINKFFGRKIYLDTSSVDGVNSISNGEEIHFTKRPSRANMQPIADSVWFAKMKGADKTLIITSLDNDLLDNVILSTGFLGIEANERLPLSLLSAIVMSTEFKVQRDLNSVGTTMAGINNETFKKINVPLLSNNEIEEFEKNYSDLIYWLSSLRKKIDTLKKIKSNFLLKFF